MECLYFPYSRCIDINHLKKALLLFDKIIFLDTEPVVVRHYLMQKKQQGFGLSEDEQNELFAAYNYLQKAGLISIVDPTPTMEKYDLLITSNINNDLKNSLFCRAAIKHSTTTWEILGSRLPKSFQASFRPGSMTFDEAILLQNVIRRWYTHIPLPEETDKFYQWLKDWGRSNYYMRRVIDATDNVHDAVELFMKEYRNVIGINPIHQESYEVPFLQASSLRITEALAVCLEKGLVPMTDSTIQRQLLGIKTESAINNIINNPSASDLYDFDLQYEMPQSDLSIKIVDELIPESVLEQMSFEDIVDYKNENKELFDSYNIEIAKLAVSMDEIPHDDKYMRRIQKIIDKDVRPVIMSLKREMNNSLAKRLGKLVLQSAGVVVPVLYASILGGLNIKGILTACAIGELSYLSTTGAEALIDVMHGIKESSSSSFAYLLNLTNNT